MTIDAAAYQELVVTAPHSAAIEYRVDEANGRGRRSVRIDVEYSGVSLGTEMSIYLGTNPRFRMPDITDAAAARIPPLRYPVRSMGYMQVGRIVSAPADPLREGQVVALRCGHRTAVIQDGFEGLIEMPPEIPAACGVWVSQLLPICANGLLHATAELVGDWGYRDTGDLSLGDGVRGRNVVVSGAGIIGLLLACWAIDLGAAAVAVIDQSTARLEAAEALGLEVDGADDPWRAIRRRWNHGGRDAGADVVLQCRGTAAALNTALRCLRPGGAVIDLAFYQSDACGVRLGEDFHHLGLTIRAAQIGNRPRGLESVWPVARLADEGIKFLRARHMALARVLLDEPVPFEHAPDVFAALVSRRGGRTFQPVFVME